MRISHHQTIIIKLRRMQLNLDNIVKVLTGKVNTLHWIISVTAIYQLRQVHERTLEMRHEVRRIGIASVMCGSYGILSQSGRQCRTIVIKLPSRTSILDKRVARSQLLTIFVG